MQGNLDVYFFMDVAFLGFFFPFIRLITLADFRFVNQSHSCCLLISLGGVRGGCGWAVKLRIFWPAVVC